MSTPTIANLYDPANRRPLSAEETQALDPAYRRANPEMAVLQEPKLAPVPHSLPYYAGRALGSGPMQGLGRTLFNHGTIPGALMTGGLGYGGGKLADWLLGLLGHETNIAPWAGAVGAVAGGVLGHTREPYVKAGSYWNTGSLTDRDGVMAEIMQRVEGSPGLSASDRVNIRAELAGMASAELSDIWRKVRNMAPFAIGAFLSHILFGTGVVGSAFGGMLTQTVANQFQNRNSAGAPFASIY